MSGVVVQAVYRRRGKRSIMIRAMIWLSYDLGVNRDYENLYYWLDCHNANECGDSVVAFFYEHDGNMVDEIKNEIKSNIGLRKKDRFYLIYKSQDEKFKGIFLFGKRKRYLWAGYAGAAEDSLEDYL